MKVSYKGEPHFSGEVYVNGAPLDPEPSQRVWNHSPDGFAWGYGGSGPAQLALALLLVELDADEAVHLHQVFKREFIAGLPQEGRWKFDVDIRSWAREHGIYWTCHVCGEERPDRKISVRSTTGLYNGVEVQQNVRYCNDRKECEDTAEEVKWLAFDTTTR